MKSVVSAQVGNALHVASLLTTFAFATQVVTKFDQFDDSWQQDGFCIANKDVKYWNSHDACLYFDTVASLVLAFAYYKLRSGQSESVNSQFKSGIPGIFAHGLGHGAIGRALRMEQISSSTLEDRWATGYSMMLKMDSLFDQVVTFVPIIVFWLFLLKSAMPNSSNTVVAAASAAIMWIQMYVPQVFGFTFVQTVLMVAFSINELLKPAIEKGFAYSIYPALVGVPVVLVGWMESTQCSNFVKDKLYGHLVYDAYIPVSFLAWYLVCYVHQARTTVAPTTKKLKAV